MTAQDPAQVPDAAAPPNTFSYIAIACGILAFVIAIVRAFPCKRTT